MLRPVAAGVLFLARALVRAAAFPAALALARARGSAAGLEFALAFGFRPGRAGGVGMAVTVLVFNLHFSIAVWPAPGPSGDKSTPGSDLSRRKR